MGVNKAHNFYVTLLMHWYMAYYQEARRDIPPKVVLNSHVSPYMIIHEPQKPELFAARYNVLVQVQWLWRVGVVRMVTDDEHQPPTLVS